MYCCEKVLQNSPLCEKRKIQAKPLHAMQTNENPKVSKVGKIKLIKSSKLRFIKQVVLKPTCSARFTTQRFLKHATVYQVKRLRQLKNGDSCGTDT